MKQENSIRLKFEGWELALFKTADGSLGITVEHPSGSLFTDIFVDRFLQVTHDSPECTEEMIQEQLEKLEAWAVARLEDSTKEDRTLHLDLCRHSWRAAQEALRNLQGYVYCQDPRLGYAPYWRRNGEVVPGPQGLPHAVAYKALERLYKKVSEKLDTPSK